MQHVKSSACAGLVTYANRSLPVGLFELSSVDVRLDAQSIIVFRLEHH